MRATDIDGYPTTCTRCGQPIVKARHDSQQHHDHATHQSTSWHTTCTTAAPGDPVKAPAPAPAARPAGAVRRNINHPTEQEQAMTTIEPEPTTEPEPQPEPEPEPETGDEE